MNVLRKLDASSALAGLAIGIVLGLMAPAALTSLSLAWEWVPLSTCLALMASAGFVQLRHPAASKSRDPASAAPAINLQTPAMREHNSLRELAEDCASSHTPFQTALRRKLMGQLEVDARLAWGMALCFASSIVEPGRLGASARTRLADIHASWSGDSSELFSDQAAVQPATLAKIESEARAILRSSAFEPTALMNALEKARRVSGVIAIVELIWLRPVSPNLWHALANVGRRTVHADCLASWSHLNAEKAAGMPIAQPQLDKAVDLVVSYRDSDMA